MSVNRVVGTWQADVRAHSNVLRLGDGQLAGAGRWRPRARLHGRLRRRSAGRQLAIRRRVEQQRHHQKLEYGPPPHLIIASTFPCEIERCLYYYLTKPKLTKII